MIPTGWRSVTVALVFAALFCVYDSYTHCRHCSVEEARMDSVFQTQLAGRHALADLVAARDVAVRVAAARADSFQTLAQTNARRRVVYVERAVNQADSLGLDTVLVRPLVQEAVDSVVNQEVVPLRVTVGELRAEISLYQTTDIQLREHITAQDQALDLANQVIQQRTRARTVEKLTWAAGGAFVGGFITAVVVLPVLLR